MEDGLVLDAETRNVLELFVLILVVMEDGLVHNEISLSLLGLERS